MDNETLALQLGWIKLIDTQDYINSPDTIKSILALVLNLEASWIDDKGILQLDLPNFSSILNESIDSLEKYKSIIDQAQVDQLNTLVSAVISPMPPIKAEQL